MKNHSTHPLEIIEVRRILDVGRVDVPGVELAARRGEVRPAVAAALDLAINLLKHRRYHVFLLNGLDLGTGRPDVVQVDILTVRSATCAKIAVVIFYEPK